MNCIRLTLCDALSFCCRQNVGKLKRDSLLFLIRLALKWHMQLLKGRFTKMSAMVYSCCSKPVTLSKDVAFTVAQYKKSAKNILSLQTVKKVEFI